MNFNITTVRRLFSPALAGAALGYLVLHPYAMLVYGIYGHEHPRTTGTYGLAQVFDTFKPGMLHMGVPYALLGAAAGLFFGLWLDAERRREESEKRATAVDTLRQLMVTLSHYLLNATTVIGGYSSRILRKETDEGVRRTVEIIKHEAECVEAVVNSLKSVQEVVAEEYTKDSENMIIDIKEQIEKHLQEHLRYAEKTKDAA